jgi:hypothetical protein
MIRKGLFILTFLLVSKFSFTQDSNYGTIISTGKRLLSFLNKCDTTSIVELHFANKESIKSSPNYREWLQRIVDDSQKFKLVYLKYGMPKEQDFNIEPFNVDGYKLTISLLNQTDSTLKLDYCKVIINFYPSRLSPLNKIYGFHLEQGRVNKNPYKLERVPRLN